ncbi:MAG: mono/diheme cytochrome c family protein [Saprospiraceae bacterium]|jgi:mono/diheme cytochrome c family protein
MKKILFFAFIAAFIIACGGNDTSAKKTKKKAKTVAVKAVDGAKIYKTYCVICHGSKGNMGSNGAFNLTTSELSIDERVAVITKGRGVMTPFEGVLKPDEIKAVAEYTLTLKK